GPGMDHPVRLEFDGDTVSSIRAFDVTTQRSTSTISSIRITPAKEILYADDPAERARPFERGSFPSELDGRRLRDLVEEGIYFDGMEWIAPHLGIPLTSVLEHLAPKTALWIDEPGAVEREVDAMEREAERLEPEARVRSPHLPARDTLFDAPTRIFERLEARTRLESSLAGTGGAGETIAVDA